MDRALSWAVVVSAPCAVLVGCATSDISWTFEFSDPASSARAERVTGRILRGGCDGEVFWSDVATRATGPEMPPALTPGTYGLEGVATDDQCIEFARGCVEITIPSDEQSVTIMLTPTADVPRCAPDACVDGACVGAMDAGPDAPDADGATRDGEVDSGTLDAPMDVIPTDGGACTMDVDCPAGTCVDGTCCNGCVVFGVCVAGDDDDACGRGGGACADCACPTDGCSAGACVPGHPVSAIATASGATCVVSEGDLFCFGENTTGQLALGTMTPSETTPMMSVGSRAFTGLGDGEDALYAVMGGTLWSWGHNMDSQLGLGDTMSRLTPTQIPPRSDWAFVEGGVLGDIACAIRTDDSLHCWGQNDFGQVGIGSAGSEVATPARITGSWNAVTLGHDHVCGIQTDGSLWCWGSNVQGQLGIGTMGPREARAAPTRVGTESDWIAVGAGEFDTCGIRTPGSLWCWGENDHGEAGQGTTTPVLTPTRVGSGSDWTAIDGAQDHVCGLRGAGELWCWGINSSGQLGNGTTGAGVGTPTRSGGATTGWRDLSLGRDHGCARAPDDALWCWGRNDTSQLGLGDTVNRPALTAVCW